ncbi:restriction endonuclease subunit S [Fusobacterium vincentii]|uniref:restriction endonuclease subunit S n=1 Tax=Fusobacterium vincentii TaxID=155615 RepID=UPI000C1C7EAD|nr:restriction endonuclease subunit S [Fusobacterium vincentii]ATV06406.1 restriction endonuclease subunit S [Fusobacterium vincentii]QYR56151.1 restriction endonuclease subunit S [Fusobacterium vincentii]
MAKNKKVEISLEEKLEKALVPVEEQPYKIPDNWVWTRLGKISKLSGGSGFPEKYQGFLDKNIPFYKVGSLKNIDDNFYIEKSENYIDDYILTEIKAKLFPENTIIFAKIGEAIRLNRRAILKENSCIDNNLMALVSNSSSYFRYIYFWLKKEDLYKYAQATTVPSIRQSTLEELEFPLPPLNEQKRIVEKLDFLFEKTKRAKEIIEEIKIDIENRKISILDRAFKGILTSKWRNENKVSDVKELLKSINDEKIKKWEEDCLQAEKDGSKKPKKPIIREVEDMIVPVEEQPYKLPDSWVWVRLGDIIDNIKYGFNASGQENGDVKLLRITDIQNDDVNWDNVPYCKISEEEYETYQLKVRDILIARTGGTIGKTFLIRKIPKNLKSVYASYLIKFYPNKNISEIYLKNYFNTDFYWKLLKMKSRGTGQPNVNSPSLQALLIPLPPLEEQKEIVRVLDEVLENENKVKELLELEERIDILEKSILNKAFRGELRTQNSSDEPAIELLKEIL